MEFGVLGPLTIRIDAKTVDLGALKQRALLIHLLLRVGETVSVDRLIDALWEHDPPPQARATLRSYVSSLRRALVTAGKESVVVTKGSGYGLQVDADAIDAVRFERLVGAASAHLSAGELDPALTAVDEALGLWRGEALADVADLAFATGERTRLEELRLSAQEDRIDVLLALGRHGEAVASAEAFTAAEPLRERVRGQLMVGLYRSGRAPDALAVFARHRESLVDELGLDPSPQLQDLAHRILNQAGDLEGATPARPRVQPRLPSRLTSIVGRQTELERLAKLLSRSRLVSLIGPGGAGKTTLAVAGARIGAGDHPDGVWFVPLAAETDPARVAVAVADAIGVPGDVETADRLLAARLGGRRALLVLDNCEHLADACARFVEHLLHDTDHLKVLVTSREALGVPGELQMPVPPLSPADAAGLFAERAAAVRPDLPLDPYAADISRICDRLDGMPLAIELAAARARTITPSEIAARLDDRFGLLTTGARTAEARHRTLRDVVEWSHGLLSPDEQALLRRLAVFHGGWTLRAAEAVCHADGSGEVLDVLGRLVERSLVVAQGDRFTMLETILAYAAERLDASGEEPAFRRAHSMYFADMARSAEPELRGKDQAGALAALRADDQNLRAALAWARDHVATEPEVGLGLAASLGWYWYVGRQVDGRTELSSMLSATPSAPDDVRARALQALSLSLRPGGCIVHAHTAAADAAHESAVLFDRVGDRSRAALSRLLLAVEGVDSGDVPAHLDAVAEARHVLDVEQDPWGVALADFVEMEIRLHQEDVAEALEIGRRAAAGFDALGDPWGRSAVRLHLGIGLRLAGDLEHAIPVLADAVRISRNTSLDNNLARSLQELGEAMLCRGQFEEAERRFDEAASVAEELGDGLLQALVLAGRGDLARLRDDPTTAHAHYLQAQASLAGVAGPRGVVRALEGLAASSLDLAATWMAGHHLETASMVAAELNDAGLRASVLEQQARLAAALDNRVAAVGLLGEAEALRKARGRPRTPLEQRDVDSVTDSV